jgi:hypothetical protein
LLFEVEGFLGFRLEALALFRDFDLTPEEFDLERPLGLERQ